MQKKKGLNMKKKIIKIISLLLFLFLIIFGGCLFINKKPQNAEINIAFNTDNAYKEYTKVAIKSAIINKNKESIYHINVLCVDLKPSDCDSYKKFEEKNVTIKTVPLELKSINNIGNYELDHHVSRADLFKFLLADIFPDLDKILYIDSDTFIRKDLSELYNTDIHKYYLAAVKKAEPEQDQRFNIFKKWELVNIYTYNCGVLLLNLEKIRKDNIIKKLIKAKNDDQIRDLQTQRSFNEVIPIETVKLLSPVYNSLDRWEEYQWQEYNFPKIYFPYTLAIKDIGQLKAKTVIAHFAGRRKPWYRESDSLFVDEWWEYAHMVNPEWKIEKSPYEQY